MFLCQICWRFSRHEADGRFSSRALMQQHVGYMMLAASTRWKPHGKADYQQTFNGCQSAHALDASLRVNVPTSAAKRGLRNAAKTAFAGSHCLRRGDMASSTTTSAAMPEAATPCTRLHTRAKLNRTWRKSGCLSTPQLHEISLGLSTRTKQQEMDQLEV